MKKRITLALVSGLIAASLFGGVASADGPHLGPDKNNLLHSGAAAPHIIGPGPDAGSANGAINGFNFEFGVGPDLTNPAVIGITNSPLCPLHPID